MKIGLMKNSLSLLSSFIILALSLFLFQVIASIQVATQENLDSINQIKKDIQIVKTLSKEGPKDIREVDLLEKLTGYCKDVNIRAIDCSIKSQTPLSNEEYFTQRYSVSIRNILMDAAVDYYLKLEELPENVRVLKSSLSRFEQRPQPSTLVLNIEMNEIRFRQ